jgi:hypothetical protein
MKPIHFKWRDTSGDESHVKERQSFMIHELPTLNDS